MTDLRNLYHQAEDYFFRGIAAKCLHLGDGANAYMTGGAGLNCIYITSDTNSLDKILIQGKHFFDRDNFCFDVIIPQEWCTPQIVDVLNSMDYSKKDKSVAMVVDLNKFFFDQTANLSDETMIKANDNQLSQWVIPLLGAFQSTAEICLLYAAAHKNALKWNINLRHFSLYKEEKPIASITLSMYDETIARIDDVGTLPGFQGKGYASMLIRYILTLVKKSGVRYCFLESSESGLGIYQKIGFQSLFSNNIYGKNA